MENKRPTGHGKKVGSGSAHVEKGEKVSSRPVGTGSGRTGSFDQRPGENRDGERSTAGKLGLLALLLVLPKKYRRILLIVIAVVAVLGISIIMLALSYLKLRNPNAYLLVLHYDEEVQIDIENELRRSVRFYRISSKTVTRAGAEMTVEIRLDHRANIVSQMLDINGVHDATLVACQTEAGA